MSKRIEPIKANSEEGGEVYRLLCMVHKLAGSLSSGPRAEFWLARTQIDPAAGPVMTTWSNGIVDIEAKSWIGHGGAYHEYHLYPVNEGSSNE
jgi:hypothetical protein